MAGGANSRAELRDLGRRVLGGLGSIALWGTLGKIALLVFEVVLAAHLGPAAYGVFAVLFATLLVVSNLCLFGMNFAAIQYLSIYQETVDRRAQQCVVRSGLVFVGLLGLAAGAALWSLAGTVADGLFGDPVYADGFRVMALIVPFETLSQFMSAAHRGFRRYTSHVVTMDLARNALLVGSLPLIFAGGLAVDRIFWVILAATLAGSVYGFASLRKDLWSRGAAFFDVAMTARLLRFSYRLFLWNVLQKSANRIFVIIAGVFLPSASVGVLALIMRFATLMAYPQNAINAVVPVEFARLYHRDELQLLNRLYQGLALLLVTATALLAMPMLVAPDHVLRLVGPHYAAYGWALWLMTFAHLANAVTGPAGQLLISCRRQGILLRVTVVDVALQFGFTVPLMWYYGLAGAIFGEAARIFAMVALRQVVVYKALGIYSITVRFAAFLGATAAAVGLSQNWALLDLSDELELIVASSSGGALFLAMVAAVIMLDRGFVRELGPMVRLGGRPSEGIE